VLVGVVNFQVLNSWLGGNLGMAIPFGAASVQGAGPLLLSEAQERWLVALPLALAVLLWAAAYARLTEKQL
jgi:4-hydroxybenzoate polyprenyltransferase